MSKFHSVDIQNQIKGILGKFQEGYAKRDLNRLDEFMSELFAKGNDVAALGIAYCEWCLGEAAVREMIKGDWEGWHNVVIDCEGARIAAQDETAWFSTTGSLEYVFEDSEKKYDDWVELLQFFGFDKESEFSVLSAKARLAQMNWLITHILDQRKEEKRKYLVPFRLSGVLTLHDGKWQFRQMQYSIPAPQFSDFRLNPDDKTYWGDYEAAKEAMKTFEGKAAGAQQQEVKDTLRSFQADYINPGSMDLDDIISNYFLDDESIYAIDTENPWYEGRENIKGLIKLHRRQWQDMMLDIDEAIINVNGDTAWIMTSSVNKQLLQEDTLFGDEIQRVQDIFAQDIPSKDKLFRVRSEVSRLFWELSYGKEALWLGRFEAVMLRQDGKWFFHNIQFSYSNGWNLEGKHDIPLLD